MQIRNDRSWLPFQTRLPNLWLDTDDLQLVPPPIDRRLHVSLSGIRRCSRSDIRSDLVSVRRTAGRRLEAFTQAQCGLASADVGVEAEPAVDYEGRVELGQLGRGEGADAGGVKGTGRGAGWAVCRAAPGGAEGGGSHDAIAGMCGGAVHIVRLARSRSRLRSCRSSAELRGSGICTA